MQFSQRILIVIFATTATSLCVLAAASPQKSNKQERKPELPKIVRKSGHALQQSAIKRVEPVYPAGAQAQGVQGSVVVEVTTDEEGKVVSIRTISGHPLLKAAAEEAAAGWIFTPTKLSGVPVKVIGALTFDFGVGDKGLTDKVRESPSNVEIDAGKYTSAVVSIPTDDEIYFGEDRVTQADIPRWIKAVFKSKPPDEQTVYIKASRSVKYGTVVSVMDAIREAGFNRIGLVAQRGDPEKDDSKDLPNSSDEATKSERSSTSRNKPKRDVNSPSLMPDELILIEVKLSGGILINSQAVSLAKLPSALETLLSERNDRTVFIKAPRNMLYGEVVKVIDIVKGAGARPIGLQVDYLE